MSFVSLYVCVCMWIWWVYHITTQCSCAPASLVCVWWQLAQRWAQRHVGRVGFPAHTLTFKYHPKVSEENKAGSTSAPFLSNPDRWKPVPRQPGNPTKNQWSLPNNPSLKLWFGAGMLCSLTPSVKVQCAHLSFYIQGIYQTLLSKATYDKLICKKKEKQQYIAVSTVRMFIEPSVKH